MDGMEEITQVVNKKCYFPSCAKAASVICVSCGNLLCKTHVRLNRAKEPCCFHCLCRHRVFAKRKCYYCEVAICSRCKKFKDREGRLICQDCHRFFMEASPDIRNHVLCDTIHGQIGPL